MIVISYIFHILAVAIGIYCYVHGRKDYFVISLYLIFSSFVGFIPSNQIHSPDWGMALAFGAMLLANIRKETPTIVKEDTLGLLIFSMVGYIFVRAIFSIILIEDTSKDILLTIRPVFFWLTYFAFRDISLYDLKKSLKIILPLMILQNCFIFLQLFGLSIFNYSPASFGDKLGVANNSDILFFLLLQTNFRNWKFKKIIIVLMLFLMFCSSRFHFILWLLFFIHYKTISLVKIHKKVLLIIAGIIIPFTLFCAYKLEIHKILGGRYVEIENDITNFSSISRQSSIYDDYLQSGNSSTFLFRLNLAKEKWIYLVQHPAYLFFGVGPIYDDPNNKYNRFNFYLGTVRSDKRGFHQIETVDIAYVTHFFRYGLIGFIPYVLVLFYLFRNLNNVKNIDPIFHASYSSFILYVFQSLGSNKFDRFQFMYLILIIVGVSYNARKYGLLRNRDS